MKEEAEGFVFVAFVFEPEEGLVGDEVVVEAFEFAAAFVVGFCVFG